MDDFMQSKKRVQNKMMRLFYKSKRKKKTKKVRYFIKEPNGDYVWRVIDGRVEVNTGLTKKTWRKSRYKTLKELLKFLGSFSEVPFKKVASKFK